MTPNPPLPHQSRLPSERAKGELRRERPPLSVGRRARPPRRGFGVALGLMLTGGCRAILGVDDLDIEGNEGVEGLEDPGGSAASAAGSSAGGASGAGGAQGGTSGGSPLGGQAGKGGGAAGASGRGGVCAIEDKAEPNDRPEQAKRLPDVNTCDFGKSSDSAMTGGDDDWYSFRGTRNVFGGFLCEKVDAWAMVPAVAPVRVCYYMKPAAAVSCPQGTEFGDDAVPADYAGCCASNGASVTFTERDADVLIKVSPASPASACFSYTLQYNY